jgi:hypothetical protein
MVVILDMISKDNNLSFHNSHIHNQYMYINELSKSKREEE